MPKNPSVSGRNKIHTNLSRDIVRSLISPLSIYTQCESAAFVRQALNKANDLNLLPSEQTVYLGTEHRRSKDILKTIKTEKHWNRSATIASTHMQNARLLLEQGEIVGDSVKPILYYYGGVSFLNFITSCTVRRQKVGTPGHGLSVSCSSDGWDFSKNWARDNCFIEMGNTGDFPFYIDALTVAGWPSLFSGYRLQQETKFSPWEVKVNPLPLLSGSKVSLDYLCNFDFDRFRIENPEIQEWLVGTDWKLVWKFTTLLLDFVILYIASSLARYYIPAWRQIIQAEKSPIYNDFKAAYLTIHEELPYYFEDEHPFQSSFGTRIGS